MKNVIFQRCCMLLACFISYLTQSQVLPDGNFETGIGSASSGYSPACPASGFFGDYCITTSGAGFGGQFLPVTPCLGNWLMCCDAMGSTTTQVWGQTATGLTPGCTYQISFCLTTISGIGNANFLELHADGNPIASGIGTTLGWVTHSANFTATGATAFIEIIQTAVAQNPAFDFALDNIAIATVDCSMNNCYYIPRVGPQDYGSQTIETPSGNIMTIGTLSNDPMNSDQDVYLVEHDLSINMTYNTKFGDNVNGTYQEYCTSIMTDGQFYYSLGFVRDGDQTAAIYLTKTDLSGSPVWVNGGHTGLVYGLFDEANDIGHKIIDMPNADPSQPPSLLIVGHTNRVPETRQDIFALKIDKNTGAVLAYTVYPAIAPNEGSEDWAYDVVEIQHQGRYHYAIAGEQRYWDGGNNLNRNAVGLIIDENLNLLADFSTIGMEDSEEVAYTVIQLGEELYFGGYHAFFGRDRDAMVIKASINFPLIIPTELHYYDGILETGVTRDDVFKDVELQGDFLVFAGHSNNQERPDLQDGMCVWLTPALGTAYPNPPLITTYPEQNDAFYDVCILPNEIMWTGMLAYDRDDEDIFLVKTGPRGENDCCLQRFEFKHKRIEPPFHPVFEDRRVEIDIKDWGLREEYYAIREYCTEKSRHEMHVMQPTSTDDAMEVFPNPSEGLITLRLQDANDVIDVVQVFDATGKIVYAVSNGQNQSQLVLDLSALSAGIYTMETRTLSGDKLTRRVSLID
ncbi:MAG: T9SS type A sorting domain-containing protein [Flavobacteriales bacterium]